MFGYINVNGAQLSEENKKIYQSYYCGLCRKLKEFCGKKGQALLNYDMTFLVVLYDASDEKTAAAGKRYSELCGTDERSSGILQSGG